MLRAWLLWETLPFAVLLAVVCWGWRHADQRGGRAAPRRRRPALRMIEVGTRGGRHLRRRA